MSHGDDDDGNDAQLRSLRAVWLAMPDENPPERGLDALLAAARTKASEMAASSSEMAAATAKETTAPGWWERFVSAFRRPTVLALATVVVLVGGAVIIGNRQMKASAPTGAAPPSAEDVPTEMRERESLKEQAPPPPQMVQGSASSSHDGLHLAAPEAPGDGFAEGGKESNQTAVDKKNAEVVTAPDHGTEGKWTANVLPGADASEGSNGDAAKKKQKLLDQAKTAAARGDCNSARTVAREIEKQDLGYYRSRVVPDRAISDCLQGRATGATTIDATSAAPSD